jgi:hypothetical protein
MFTSSLFKSSTHLLLASGALALCSCTSRSSSVVQAAGPQASRMSFSQFVQDLRAEVHAGRSVAVHSRASIGRLSWLVAALLTAEGFTADARSPDRTAPR